MEDRLNVSDVKEGMRIEYIGKSWAFGGDYKVVTAESTYRDPADCPDDDKGKLMIIEFMNNGTPMFFRVDRLNTAEWQLVP